jgi:hypothetical protein
MFLSKFGIRKLSSRLLLSYRVSMLASCWWSGVLPDQCADVHGTPMCTVRLVCNRFSHLCAYPEMEITGYIYFCSSLHFFSNTTLLSRMQTFHPENITAAISAFRPDGEIPVLNEQLWDGGQCRIYKVDFTNGESWSVRIPIHVQSDSQDTIIDVLQGEQSVLQELSRTDFPWAPKHYGSSLTFENLVGFPFMALSWIEGSPLRWTLTDPPRPVRNKVLAQVARIQMSLIECTKEDSVSKYSPSKYRFLLIIAGGTAAQYFSRLIDNKLRRVRSGELAGITVQDCHDQEVLLDRVVDSKLEHAPFAIDHGDLAPLNIIVNPEFDVTG